MSKKNFIYACIAVFVAALTRISFAFPQIPNFSPLESIALFSGAVFLRKYFAFLVPLAIMYVSDFALNNTLLRGFYPGQEGVIFYADYMLYNLIAIVAIVAIGSVVIKKIKFANVIAGSVLGTIVFFLITNLGSFLTSPLYPSSFSGLLLSYEAGLPFLKNSMISNLVFAAVLFGVYKWVTDSAVKTLGVEEV